MTRSRFLIPVVAAALLLAATPADASYGATRLVRSCPGGIQLAATVSGTLWGATWCRENPSIQIVTASPAGAWRRISTPWSGLVLAVADDGATTFVLWVGSDHRVRLGKRPHSGSVSAPTVLSSQTGGTGGALVARGGQWWAVWEETYCTGHFEGCSATLWQAKSLGRGLRPERVLTQTDKVGTFDVLPSLALLDEAAVLVFLRRDDTGDAMHYATAGLDGGWVDSIFEPSVGATAFGPHVTTANGRVVVGWARNQRPVIALQDATGHFTRYALPYRAQTASVLVAASGGRAFAGHDSCFVYRDGQTCRSYVSTVTADGAVTGTTELSAGTGDHTTWGMSDLVAARGVATAGEGTATSLVTRSGF